MNLKEAMKNVANVPNKYDKTGGAINGTVTINGHMKLYTNDDTDVNTLNSDTNVDIRSSNVSGSPGQYYNIRNFAHGSKTRNMQLGWYYGGANKLKYRVQNANNSTWGEWGEIYSTTNKPSASDIGAAPSSHNHSYLPLSGGTVSASTFGPLTVQRSGSVNGAGIGFSNSNGTLGYIGMLGSANGGLVRWTADTSTYYVMLDANNYKTYVTPASIGASATSHTHNYIPTTASCNKNWNWSGQSGQPTWVWGGNDSTNMYVYNPSNFKVSYATSAGNSSKIGGKTIFVQQSQPTATATGDIWISW